MQAAQLVQARVGVVSAILGRTDMTSQLSSPLESMGSWISTLDFLGRLVNRQFRLFWANPLRK